MSTFLTLASLLLYAQVARAQFPPKPTGTTVLQSKFGDGVYISYKEVSTKISMVIRVNTKNSPIC